MKLSAGFELDSRGDSIQSLGLPGRGHRAEGIAYSPSGDIIATATSDTDTVYFFRRKADGAFETAPYASISGTEARLNYPHDIAFSSAGNDELMAVAQRGGAITLYRRNDGDGTYGPKPIFEIRGPDSGLEFSDGVAFVPPRNLYLAVCDLQTNTLLFYRRTSTNPVHFNLKPELQLRHPSLQCPDGLGFSPCGRWLAVANHGGNTVAIFRRRSSLLSWGKLQYGPEPVMVIAEPSLCFPHSVAFTPKTNHLVVTNAGANYFNVYEPTGRGRDTRWSSSPVVKRIVGNDQSFKEINVLNKMEGGPKGIAIHGDAMAVCSPAHGIRIFSFREGMNGSA